MNDEQDVVFSAREIPKRKMEQWKMCILMSIYLHVGRQMCAHSFRHHPFQAKHDMNFNKHTHTHTIREQRIHVYNFYYYRGDEKRGRRAWLYVKRSVQSLRIDGVDGNMWTNTPILYIWLRQIWYS